MGEINAEQEKKLAMRARWDNDCREQREKVTALEDELASINTQRANLLALARKRAAQRDKELVLLEKVIKSGGVKSLQALASAP